MLLMQTTTSREKSSWTPAPPPPSFCCKLLSPSYPPLQPAACFQLAIGIDPEVHRRDHGCLEKDVKRPDQAIGEGRVETEATMADLTGAKFQYSVGDRRIKRGAGR